MKATSIVIFLFCIAAQTVCYAEPVFEPAFPDLQFKQPVFLTHAGDGSNRLFVVEQGGMIRVFDNTKQTKTSDVFFNIQQHSEAQFLSGGEQGLLGLAFDPNFAENGFFYVNYTARSPRRTVVSKFQVEDPLTLTIKPGSEMVLLEIEQDYSNHNGGMIAFGADGFLYVGMGDGGSAGDPNQRAQDGQSLLGKLLRIDTNGRAPEDNPFVGNDSMRDEIWAMGLRNPWRFSFDRKTNALWLGDVGQNEVEEVNLITKGGNYGWRWYEGSQTFKPDDRTKKAKLIGPVFEYHHDVGQSITGGYVYRGKNYPALAGLYFFADFVSGRTWALNADNGKVQALPKIANPSSFGEDEQGELYVLTYGGEVLQVVDR